MELIGEEIDFGSFYVNTSCGECYIDTNGNVSPCCVGANNIISGFRNRYKKNTIIMNKMMEHINGFSIKNSKGRETSYHR